MRVEYDAGNVLQRLVTALHEATSEYTWQPEVVGSMSEV